LKMLMLTVRPSDSSSRGGHVSRGLEVSVRVRLRGRVRVRVGVRQPLRAVFATTCMPPLCKKTFAVWQCAHGEPSPLRVILDKQRSS